MSDDDLIRRGDALAAIRSPAFHYDRIAAIAALPAVTVVVKPLVWEDFGDWGAKASAYYQANYLIQFWKGREQFEVALSYPGYQTGFDGDRWHHTLDAAKAAAQADYEARILAALEPQPAPDAAAIREAAAKTLLDMLYMRNGAQNGMTREDVQRIWDAASTREGYAAVEAFLLALITEKPHDRA